LTYGDLSVLEQSRLLRDFSYGGAEGIVLTDHLGLNNAGLVRPMFSSDTMQDTLSQIDDASLIQTMTALTRELPREASLRQELLRDGRHLPDAGYGELIRRTSESGGIERLARVAAGIGSPYASQDLATKALNLEISKSTARQGMAIGSKRAISLSGAAGPDPFRFVKHSGILSELGMSYFQPNTMARFMSRSDTSMGTGSVGRSITQSKILATNTMTQRMRVRYRNQAGELAEGNLFDLARTQPGVRLVQQDAVDATNTLIPIGGAVSVDQTANVTAGSLNRARLSKVTGEHGEMFNIYMAGEGTTTEEARILADSLVQAAREEVTSLDSRLLDSDDLVDIDPEEVRHMQESLEETRSFLAGIDAPFDPDDSESHARTQLVETLKSQRSFHWDNKR